MDPIKIIEEERKRRLKGFKKIYNIYYPYQRLSVIILQLHCGYFSYNF